MSWYLPHRLNPIHRAISFALLYSVGSAVLLPAAQAATIGKTIITSAQYEPLAASIDISDVDATNFSASLANAAIYQQMGLTPTTSMSIQFVPTSATTGQVLISTSQPVSTPFTDVVLAINDSGQRKMVPKTLLMPLSDNVAVDSSTNKAAKSTTRVTAGAPKPNLPIVSALNAQPLTVKKGAPPPLISASGTQAAINAPVMSSLTLSQAADMPSMNVAALSPQDDNISVTDRITDTVPNTTSSTSFEKAFSNSDSATTHNNDNKTNASQVSNLFEAGSIDKQLDVLNIQVTRQIQRKDSLDNNNQSTPLMITAQNQLDHSVSQDRAEPESQSAPATSLPAQQTANSTQSTLANSSSSYVVQRNDNLWIISQQIAQQNNVDIQTVMQQIKAQNPDAFIAKNSNLLKANAELKLPSYDVIPSQQSLQTAIAAQRQYYLQTSAAKSNKDTKKASSSKSDNKQTVAAKAIPARSKSSSKRAEEPAKTTIKTLPRAQFSVVAPGRDGSADGTQTKATAATGNGLSTDILATLKSARQRRAAQAQRVAQTSSALSQYTQRLQLQNQKLADLQARLKKLRNQ